MSKSLAINTIWRWTLISFIFAQVVSVIVVVSALFSEEKVNRYEVLGAYLLFLLFSGFVYLALQYIGGLVRRSYGEQLSRTNDDA